MKRFYKEVSLEQVGTGWQVMLDGRGIKTVKGSPQIVPTEPLAKALAAEWQAQGEKLDPALFPLRDMADYAIDIISADRASAADKMTAYGDTDTLLYRADPDEPLYARQQAVWEPTVTAFEARALVQFTRVSGIMHRPQPEETAAKLRAMLLSHSDFALAGVEAMTNLAASLIIGLSASQADDEASALALWDAASLEEDWQAKLWGRDEEAEAHRTKRQADFLKAFAFTRLAQDG